MAIFSRKKKIDIPAAPAAVRKGVSALAARVLIRPHVTEKASAAGSRGEYAFVVRPHATKPEVRRAVEEHYAVTVRAVRVVNLPGKVRKRGRVIGWRPGLRKAIVTLAPGQSIDLTATS